MGKNMHIHTLFDYIRVFTISLFYVNALPEDPWKCFFYLFLLLRPKTQPLIFIPSPLF